MPKWYVLLAFAPSLLAPEHRSMCAQLKRDFVPYMEEALELESGFDTDMLMDMPPVWVAGHLQAMRVATLPGTKKNEGKDIPREHVTRKVRMMPSLLVACDGAATFNLTGERFGDMFSAQMTWTTFCACYRWGRGRHSPLWRRSSSRGAQ